jgi:hypothetical protein
VDNIKIDLKGTGLDDTDWIDLAQKGSCEQGNKPSVSIKSWEVLEYLNNWQLLRKGSAP